MRLKEDDGDCGGEKAGLGSALTIGRTLIQALRSRRTVEGRTKLVKKFTVRTHWGEKEALRFSYSRLPSNLFRTLPPLSTGASLAWPQ